MFNTQSNTNFVFRIYGDIVKDITGRDEFECQLTGLPTPEIAMTGTTYSKHPLVSQMKGNMPGNVMTNDDFITAEVIIDEHYQSFLFFAKWIAAHAVATRTHAGDANTFCEIVVLDNSKKPLMSFLYNKIFPTRLNQIEYSAQLTDPGVSVVPVFIAFDSFSITDADGNEIVF